MTEREDSKSRTLTINAVSIALVAVLAVQVFHESCHAVAVVLVGGCLKWFNLFGASYRWSGEMSQWRQTIIAGSAPLMNSLIGMVAVALFSRRRVMRRPRLRLFFFYFGAYSLLMGFGTLMMHSLTYQPGLQHMADWAKVLDLFGGSLVVRIAMGLIGAIGYFWVYFWLVRSVPRFGDELAERFQRARLAGSILMDPYLTISVVFTILSFWHPIGSAGSFEIILQYWFGYFAFFVAFFHVVCWTKVRTPLLDATPLPDQLSWPWLVGAAVALGIASFVLLPTIYF